ncbi:unnamed protein product, partial [Polarella glacialis]
MRAVVCTLHGTAAALAVASFFSWLAFSRSQSEGTCSEGSAARNSGEAEARLPFRNCAEEGGGLWNFVIHSCCSSQSEAADCWGGHQWKSYETCCLNFFAPEDLVPFAAPRTSKLSSCHDALVVDHWKENVSPETCQGRHLTIHEIVDFEQDVVWDWPWFLDPLRGVSKEMLKRIHFGSGALSLRRPRQRKKGLTLCVPEVCEMEAIAAWLVPLYLQQAFGLEEMQSIQEKAWQNETHSLLPAAVAYHKPLAELSDLWACAPGFTFSLVEYKKHVSLSSWHGRILAGLLLPVLLSGVLSCGGLGRGSAIKAFAPQRTLQDLGASRGSVGAD